MNTKSLASASVSQAVASSIVVVPAGQSVAGYCRMWTPDVAELGVDVSQGSKFWTLYCPVRSVPNVHCEICDYGDGIGVPVFNQIPSGINTAHLKPHVHTLVPAKYKCVIVDLEGAQSVRSCFLHWLQTSLWELRNLNKIQLVRDSITTGSTG